MYYISNLTRQIEIGTEFYIMRFISSEINCIESKQAISGPNSNLNVQRLPDQRT